MGFWDRRLFDALPKGLRSTPYATTVRRLPSPYVEGKEMLRQEASAGVYIDLFESHDFWFLANSFSADGIAPSSMQPLIYPAYLHKLPTVQQLVTAFVETIESNKAPGVAMTPQEMATALNSAYELVSRGATTGLRDTGESTAGAWDEVAGRNERLAAEKLAALKALRSSAPLTGEDQRDYERQVVSVEDVNNLLERVGVDFKVSFVRLSEFSAAGHILVEVSSGPDFIVTIVDNNWVGQIQVEPDYIADEWEATKPGPLKYLGVTALTIYILRLRIFKATDTFWGDDRDWDVMWNNTLAFLQRLGEENDHDAPQALKLLTKMQKAQRKTDKYNTAHGAGA